MNIIDITGPIHEGMWNYNTPGGPFRIIKESYVQDGNRECIFERFSGVTGVTGTFYETSATYLGYRNSISTDMISLEKIVNVDAYVLQIPYDNLNVEDNKKCITLEDVKEAEKVKIPKNSVVLISTGYGKNWEKEDYLENYPYFKKEAMYYLIDKKPTILGADFFQWDNVNKPENFLKRLYESGVVLLVSCINLEKIKKSVVKFIGLPINIKGICMCPVRAVVIEE